MLDKQAEKVLKIAIAKYKDNSSASIKITPTEADMQYMALNSLCALFYKKGYIAPFNKSNNEEDPVEITLTHEGKCYFEYKRKKFLWALFNNLWIPLTLNALIKILPTLLRYLTAMLHK